MLSETEQSGYSGIMEAPGELVHGALYEMTEQELIAMDNLEDPSKNSSQWIIWRIVTKTHIKGRHF